MQNQSKITWFTISKYVDLDTGEEISSRQAKNYYQIMKKTINFRVTNNIGSRIIINECKYNGQLKIWTETEKQQ